jgi:hypothetical protein
MRNIINWMFLLVLFDEQSSLQRLFVLSPVHMFEIIPFTQLLKLLQVQFALL